jgi:Flp pilus assembly pilin Flp
MNRHSMAQLPFDPIRDFAPVAMLTRNSMVLAAGTAQPFADLQGMLDRARREPGRVGTGSTEALSAFLGQELARRAGLDTPDVQYRSGGPLMNDIVAGHLPVGWTSTASVTPHVPTGRIRVLATAGRLAHAVLPRSAEPWRRRASPASRFPAGWRCSAPPPCPRPSPNACHALLRPAFADANFRARLATLGIEPDLRPADALREEMRREDAFWAAAARAGTLKPPGDAARNAKSKRTLAPRNVMGQHATSDEVCLRSFCRISGQGCVCLAQRGRPRAEALRRRTMRPESSPWRGVTTMARLLRDAKRALADRKGVTSLEYAVMLMAVSPAVIMGYQNLAAGLSRLLALVIGAM